MIILSNIQKLYDGSSATAEAIKERMDVWVDGAMIKAVHPHKPTHPQGSEVKRVDCSAYTVTPGLIDCHGHVGLEAASRAGGYTRATFATGHLYVVDDRGACRLSRA
jgi:imidazolonepropionase-like amidohydrolase